MRLLRSIMILCWACVLSSCATMTQRGWVPPPDFLDSASTQAVVVRPDGTGFKVKVTAFEKNKVSGAWDRVMGPFSGVVGRSGIAVLNEKHEGDGKTPSGIFPLGPAFGKEVALETGLSYRQTFPDDVWVDDTKSPQYNQWVKTPTGAASFEKMLREDGLYDAGIVVQYNTTPVIPGRGSAIFMHIWRDNGRAPTAGCVALEQRRLRELLKWLDIKKKPVIVIGN
ncbi:MAG: L,D-transpeptidase family protein [Candidatus Omnitrophica bacterium]|nr:L,D-transpeptidase family protein [Candidatus Omnitrophota bacterium]